MNPFQSIGAKRPQSSRFDLSHDRKFSFQPGKLYPILNAEALPSDVWQYDANALVRMMPMLAPLMHQVDVCVHSFFHPERLTQRQGYYDVFITGGNGGDGLMPDGSLVQIPHFNVKGTGTLSDLFVPIDAYLQVGSLADYLGVQYTSGALGGTDTQAISARPFIAFWRIYNEYFRDQNVMPDVVGLYPDIFDSIGGDITPAIHAALVDGFEFFTIPQVCWEKDMYTSALPNAQRGAAVQTPLDGQGIVEYTPISSVFRQDGGLPFTSKLNVNPTNADVIVDSSVTEVGGRVENIQDVSLTSGGFTIEALRVAARLQEFQEKLMRGGARLTEFIKQIFGVTSSDARLQRPEYLGGGKIPMNISEVLQTSENGTTPLAEMAGHGVTMGNVTAFKKFCEEYGYFQVFIFLRPKTAYQNGLPRMWWNRFDRLDYANPSFAHIGEQEVLQKELCWMTTNATDNQLFGYQERFVEYKYIPSSVHGEYRTTQDFWHWGRQFSLPPTIGPEFVLCDPDQRIFNVISEGDSLYCIVHNRITAKRPLPYRGTPYL